MTDLTEADLAPHGRDAQGEPKAPYGYTVEGRPRKSAGGRRPKGSSSAPTRKRSTSARKPPAAPSYRDGIVGMLQMAAAGLSMGARFRPVLAADAAAIMIHGEPIADAVDDLAQEHPEIAAILDRFMKIGPYGALLTAIMPLGFQLAANRGILPPGAMGTVDPRQLIGAVQAQAGAFMTGFDVDAAPPSDSQSIWPDMAAAAGPDPAVWPDDPAHAAATGFGPYQEEQGLGSQASD